MRLDKVYIDGFKNLKRLEIDFDESKLTTVLIGQNGAGKSNLIEAITRVFRWVDLHSHEPRFRYRVDYHIDDVHITLSNIAGESSIAVNGKEVSRTEFEKNKREWFPDLIFGYYSGSNRHLESTFDTYQTNYYKAIARNNDEAACYEALLARRLFYCRPVHGVIALLALFAFPDEVVIRELFERLRINGFHSVLALFREPWYAKGGKAVKAANASNFWGADGPAGRTAGKLKALAFHPFGLTGNAIDDYRSKRLDEAQFATFLPSIEALSSLREEFSDDGDLFYALEALDVSDLIRDIMVWVTREGDNSGDVGFSDLSDGERQLLMVLGLIRISRGKRALFLLDEPDTHLNPHWQHSYLRLIEDWTGIAANKDNCHVIISSHNPLTISALTRDEVRILSTSEDGCVSCAPPYADPKGMGFTATLTEIFGLNTSLDIDTQRLVDERNALAKLTKKSDKQEREFIKINDELARLGFLFEDREPLYQDFLRTWHDVRYADRPPLTPEKIAQRHQAMKTLIQGLTSKEEKS